MTLAVAAEAGEERSVSSRQGKRPLRLGTSAEVPEEPVNVVADSTAKPFELFDDEEHLAAHRTLHGINPTAEELIFNGLRQERFCRLIDEADVWDIIKEMKYYAFGAGEAVVTQGSAGRYFFVVNDGVLEVRMDGKVRTTLTRGSAFGAIALLYNCPRIASVVAKENSGVWGADGETFRRVVREHAQRQAQENWRFVECAGIFDGLSTRQKQRIGELALVVVSFESGARIITSGEAPSAIFVVKKGELRVIEGGVADQGEGIEGGTTHSRLAVGDTFGGYAVLSGEPTPFSVVADQECELVSLGVRELRETLGQDLLGCLERSFIRSIVMDQLPLISSLVATQRDQILSAMKFKSYAKYERVEEGLRIVAVVQGELQGSDDKGGLVVLQRGQARQDYAEVQSMASSGIPNGLVAGETGARLAMLTRAGLVGALKSLGLAAIGAAEEDSVECMRMMLLLKKVPIFRELPQEKVDRLASALVMRRYVQGATVFKQGEVGNNFFIVSRGEALLSIDGAQQRSITSGACFGERALFVEEPRPATVEVTSEEAVLWSLNRKDLKELLTADMLKVMEEVIRQQEDSQLGMKTLYHVRIIGIGRFGSVRLVEERHTGVRYALKRIKKRQGRVPVELERECAILADIQHPFVLRMIKTFETPGSFYVLAELMTGGQLHTYLARKGRFSHIEAQFYVGFLAVVLEHLHERGVVYRDLTPENVMLDAQGYPKLIDFNWAKKLDMASMQTYTLVGTPFYMAPEVIKGKGYGLEVDIWSLGVVFYELVCGRLPFGDGKGDQGEILAAILDEPLNFPSAYQDASGRRLISRLLTKERSLRLGMGILGWQEIKDDLFFLQDDSGCLFEKVAARELPAPIVPSADVYPDEQRLGREATLSDAEELGGTGTRESKKRKLTQLFKRFDINGTGTITRSELGSILKILNPSSFSEEELDKMMDTIDTNKDGVIDYEEFSSWVFSAKAGAFCTAVGLKVHN